MLNFGDIDFVLEISVWIGNGLLDETSCGLRIFHNMMGPQLKIKIGPIKTKTV